MPERIRIFIVCFMVVLLAFFSVGLSTSTAAEAAAKTPTQQLKAGVDSLIAVLTDQSLKDEAGKKNVEDKVVELFQQHFDLAYTSQMCLGRHWRKLSREERNEFVSLFTDLLKSTYLNRVHEYSGETVKYKKEILRGKKALVKTVVISKGKEIPVDYKMVNRGNGNWQVYDVVIEGVSMVRNYRSQFSSILQKKKFADLLDQIRDKIAQNKAVKDAEKEPQKG